MAGRQIFQLGSAAATGWRLTNHFTRVTNVSGDMRVERYDVIALAWEATDFQFGTVTGAGGSANFTANTNWATVTVLCNRPEAAIIRLTGDAGGGGAAFTVTLDLGVRRGGSLIEGRFTYYDATHKPAIFRDASEAGTAITGGIEATAANASGNKYVILSPNAITKDVTGTSGIELTSAGSYIDIGIGVSNNDLITGAVTVIEEYFAAHRFRQAVVAR